MRRALGNKGSRLRHVLPAAHLVPPSSRQQSSKPQVLVSGPLGKVWKILSLVNALLTPRGSNSISNVYLLFSTYSGSRTYITNRICATDLGLTATQTSTAPFSVTSPPAADEKTLGPEALTSYVSFLNLTTCTASLIPKNETELQSFFQPLTAADSIGFPALATFSQPSSLISAASPTQSHNASSPSVAPAELETKYKVVIGVIVPITFIALTLTCILTWRRFQKRKVVASGIAAMISTESSQDAQPYLQQKAELEAEERRRHELEAEERQFEVDGTNEIHEMITEGATRRISALQELRGPEHSQELEVP